MADRAEKIKARLAVDRLRLDEDCQQDAADLRYLLDRLRAAEAVATETERIVLGGEGDTDVWDALDTWRAFARPTEATTASEGDE
ncbi:MAG: hypothetical protein JWO62_3356 [Acidimicrobiaceae bacterium]|jgi:hypothetical protein|nr:hypothetical protein [Acidimicrobiaceae bacterium]